MLVDSLFELLNIFVAIGVTDRAYCHLRIMQGKIVFGHAADALLATMRNAIQLKLAIERDREHRLDVELRSHHSQRLRECGLLARALSDRPP